eukprot:TRINITY_DN28246_c0_g1_i5.p1 TRINITY_DN28246_c0_g1~~TRINITY_DN28246_c0_g1_i5.p1  ORF type:complete len:528 (-),score=120.16 TRINITY_DN28246_c0_g1_i5:55-1638(-)
MIVEIGLLFLALFCYLYWFMTKDFKYFNSQHGIAYSKPSFPFGSQVVKDFFTRKTNPLNGMVGLAEEFPDQKVVGYFMLNTPRYFINDEELAKQVLIKDFEYFTDRPVTESADEIFNNFLTNLTGSEWKKMRSLMSGVFTSGKLKSMFPHMLKIGKNFGEYIETVAKEGKEVDMKETGGLLTLDSIATAGFGIETNSFNDQNNAFRLMALKLVGAPGHRSNFLVGIFKFLLVKGFPKLANDILKISLLDAKARNFFRDIIKRTYKQRMETGQRRNDLIDLIIDELKKSKADSTVADPTENDNAATPANQDDIQDKPNVDAETILISNALIFFFAGFETSANGIGVVCHSLCMYPELQDKVHAEIVEVLGEDDEDGEVTFDKLAELKYTDMFIAESLRHNSLISQLDRTCSKNYKVPGTEIVIPKGKVVTVFVKNLQDSTDNFVNPTAFDPENFAPENKPNKFAYMPFGQGPRNCIGMRYALLVLKLGIVFAIRNHKIVRGSTMKEELVFDVFTNTFQGGLPVTFQRR